MNKGDENLSSQIHSLSPLAWINYNNYDAPPGKIINWQSLEEIYPGTVEK